MNKENEALVFRAKSRINTAVVDCVAAAGDSPEVLAAVVALLRRQAVYFEELGALHSLTLGQDVLVVVRE